MTTYGAIVGQSKVHALRSTDPARTKCGFPQVRNGRLTRRPTVIKGGDSAVEVLLGIDWFLCDRCFGEP